MSSELNTSVERARDLLRQATTLLTNTTSTATTSHFLPGQPSSRGTNLNPTAGSTSGSDNSDNLRRQSTLREMRSIFQPYPRGTSIARRRTRVVDRPLKSWIQKFCCLGGPDDLTTPTTSRRILLADNGLGDSIVTAAEGGSAEEVREAITEKFSALVGVSFELLRAVSGGAGKLLIKLDPNDELPNVMCLKRLNYRVLYIRPQSNIIENEEQDPIVEISAYQAGAPRVAEQGCSGNDIDNVVIQDESEHMEEATLEDLRNTCYLENAGDQLIAVYREEFLVQVLGMFKDPNMNKLKKSSIHRRNRTLFVGLDIGALTKEFFYKGMTSIISEKYNGIPIFEGETDHKLPTHDTILLREGVFEIIGIFIGYSMLHTGIGLIGLSSAVVSYLTIHHMDHNTSFPISYSDINDYEVRQLLISLDDWKHCEPSYETKLKIRELAINSGFNLPINQSSCMAARDMIMYHEVIDKRKSMLHSMRCGFKRSLVFNFLLTRQHLVTSAFPKEVDFNISAEYVIGKMSVEGGDSHPHVKDAIVRFIHTQSDKPQGIRKLLTLWTAWPQLPDDGLKVTCIPGDGSIQIRTCFSEIKVPVILTVEMILAQLNRAINFCLEGFGSV